MKALRFVGSDGLSLHLPASCRVQTQEHPLCRRRVFSTHSLLIPLPHMLPVWLTDTVTSDLKRALHYTLLWGLQGVELRTVGGAEERVPDVNLSSVQHQLRANDMIPVAIAPSMFEGSVTDRVTWMNDLATFGDTLRFCTRINCPRIVVSCFAAEEDLPATFMDTAAEALRRAGKKAEAKGLTLAVLHGPSTTCPAGQDLAELLVLVDHPNVQAAWDPAAALRAGEDPTDGLAALTGLVAHVRCSDGFVTDDGYWEETDFDGGDVDWGYQLGALHEQGYRGPLSLEIYKEPRPKHGLRSATTLISMLRDIHATT